LKAVVINRYGSPDVLENASLPRPSIGKNEILVRVRATSVNPVDCGTRSGRYRYVFLLSFPAVLGVDVAGEVVEAGGCVKCFRAGDMVYAYIREGRGAYAEYAAFPASWAGRKPGNLSFSEAAAVPCAGLAALQALRGTARLRQGGKLLVVGGGGGVGTFAIQIARSLGAEVTAVCSTPKVGLVKSVGAHRVVDYTIRDYLEAGERYDVILDCVGDRTFLAFRKIMRRGGIHIAMVPYAAQFMASALSVVSFGKRSRIFLVRPGRGIDALTELIEGGKVRPVVDRVYPFDRMADAHRYSETRRAAGKIVVTID
jgi:NADPH:quinone reductase-like Zn-dependent oxidoreductase